MNKNTFASLDELRAEKLALSGRIGNDAEKLRSGIMDSVLPKNALFRNAPNRYLRIIGYGITAYKTYKNVKGVFGLFSRKRR